MACLTFCCIPIDPDCDELTPHAHFLLDHGPCVESYGIVDAGARTQVYVIKMATSCSDLRNFKAMIERLKHYHMSPI